MRTSSVENVCLVVLALIVLVPLGLVAVVVVGVLVVERPLVVQLAVRRLPPVGAVAVHVDDDLWRYSNGGVLITRQIEDGSTLVFSLLPSWRSRCRDCRSAQSSRTRRTRRPRRHCRSSRRS